MGKNYSARSQYSFSIKVKRKETLVKDSVGTSNTYDMPDYYKRYGLLVWPINRTNTYSGASIGYNFMTITYGTKVTTYKDI